MKAIATFFITWFHFQGKVPDTYSHFFVGGIIGNSLFFFASGFLLKFQEERFKGEWFIKKFLRLMPPIWTFMLLSLAVSSLFSLNIQYDWYNWVYPTHWWFINAILTFFLISYLLFSRNCLYTNNINKNGGGNFLLIIMASTAILHIVWYILFCEHHKLILDEGGFKAWFYFFFFFIYGYYSKACNIQVKYNRYSIIWFSLSIVSFYVYKKIALQWDLLIQMQVVIMPVLLFAVIHYGRAFSKQFATLHLHPKIKNSLSFLSELTLEIYIVQLLLINKFMPLISFPINVIISLFLILLAAWINKLISDKFRKALLQRI